MGGFDYFISDIFRKEFELHLGRKTIKKIENRLFEKYGITLTESMNDYAKLDGVLKEIFGRSSKGMMRAILNNLCGFKKSNRNSLVTLQNPQMTETILDMLGDKDYRKILNMLIGKSMITYEILKKVDIPQASAYRKIDALVKAGLLVEDRKIQLKDVGRPAIKLTTLYRRLDMRIVKNKILVEVKISRDMLSKSSVLCTLYSIR